MEPSFVAAFLVQPRQQSPQHQQQRLQKSFVRHSCKRSNSSRCLSSFPEWEESQRTRDGPRQRRQHDDILSRRSKSDRDLLRHNRANSTGRIAIHSSTSDKHEGDHRCTRRLLENQHGKSTTKMADGTAPLLSSSGEENKNFFEAIANEDDNKKKNDRVVIGNRAKGTNGALTGNHFPEPSTHSLVSRSSLKAIDGNEEQQQQEKQRPCNDGTKFPSSFLGRNSDGVLLLAHPTDRGENIRSQEGKQRDREHFNGGDSEDHGHRCAKKKKKKMMIKQKRRSSTGSSSSSSSTASLSSSPLAMTESAGRFSFSSIGGIVMSKDDAGRSEKERKSKEEGWADQEEGQQEKQRQKREQTPSCRSPPKVENKKCRPLSVCRTNSAPAAILTTPAQQAAAVLAARGKGETPHSSFSLSTTTSQKTAPTRGKVKHQIAGEEEQRPLLQGDAQQEKHDEEDPLLGVTARPVLEELSSSSSRRSMVTRRRASSRRRNVAHFHHRHHDGAGDVALLDPLLDMVKRGDDHNLLAGSAGTSSNHTKNTRNTMPIRTSRSTSSLMGANAASSRSHNNGLGDYLASNKKARSCRHISSGSVVSGSVRSGSVKSGSIKSGSIKKKTMRDEKKNKKNMEKDDEKKQHQSQTRSNEKKNDTLMKLKEAEEFLNKLCR